MTDDINHDPVVGAIQPTQDTMIDITLTQLENLKINSAPSSISIATGNNSTSDTKDSTTIKNPIGNNGPLFTKHEASKVASHGNNLPWSGSPIDESTLVDVDFIPDDHICTLEEKELLDRLYKERKEVLDANNMGDLPTVRPPESSFYRLLPKKQPEIAEFHNLKCSEVRWFYTDDSTDDPVPFKGQDSIKIEIKYRLKNGIDLDQEAQEVYEEHMKDLYLEKVTSTGDFDSGKKVFVKKGYYSINSENTEMIAEYWSNDTVPIHRRTYFTVNDKPVKKEVAEAIERHLNRQASTESEEFLIEKIRVVCRGPSEITMKEEGGMAKNLSVYSQKAEWNDGYSKIENLVFVVHGVGHKGKPQSIVNSAKRLIRGVDYEMKNSSGITFIPIHWRSLIDDHECIEECSKEHLCIIINLILNDVKLYNCTETGVKIRQYVIRQIKTLYDKFIQNNPDFEGSVSLFGHSLGSVICYDILTDFKKVQNETDHKLHFEVDRLFTVGSPLKIFLDHREYNHHLEGHTHGSPINGFRMVYSEKNFRIFNIYHPYDPVARRLDSLIDVRYKGYLAIRIPKAGNRVAVSRLKHYICKNIKSLRSTVRCNRQVSSGSDKVRPPQIDHEIHSKYKWRLGAHTCYWKHDGVHRFMRSVAFQNVVRKGSKMEKQHSQTTTATTVDTNEIKTEQLVVEVKETVTTSVTVNPKPFGNNEPMRNNDIMLAEKLEVSISTPNDPILHTN